MIPQRFRLFTYNPAAFGLSNIQSDPMTVGAYIPQIWGGADQLVRCNLLLNTATLATQNVTVLGLSHTLYIKGTGSVTLSGAATGTLNGTGAGNRVSLQFTPTAGTLTLTVSGSVTEGHLTRTATTDHSYQAVTDWTTEVFQYNAQRQLPWLRRNYLLNTQAASLWNKQNAGTGIAPVITDNYGMAPDGTTTAHRFQLDRGATDTSGNYSLVQSTYTANTVGQSYHHSVWLKSLSGTPMIRINDGNWALGSAITLTTAWVEYTFDATADATGRPLTVGLRGGYSTSQTADFLVWHPQKTVGTTSYQPIGADWPSTYTALAQAAGYPISLYSDRAGTIAVDSPETVVGKMLDLSTKGNHLVAPTDAARPLLKRDGNGNYYLLRDGVDDSLNVTLPNYGANCVHYSSTEKIVLKDSAITLNGATSFSVPSVDYARVLLSGPSNKDAKIQKFLDSLAGRSYPAALGPELVTNGGFDSGAGWTLDANWTIGSGVATSSGAATQQVITRSSTLPGGKPCLFVFDVVAIAGGAGFKIHAGSTVGQYKTAVGTYSLILVADVGGMQKMYLVAASGTVCVVDNVSVREILS